MPKLPHHHDRIADRMDDIASSLDAGLDASASLRTSPTNLDRGFVAALSDSDLGLSDLDRAVLEAAEKAGDLATALRGRAEAHRFIGSLQRSVFGSLAYPLFIIGFASLIFTFLISLQGSQNLWALSGFWVPVLGCAAAFFLITKRARTGPDFNASRIPGIGKIIRDLGELPYLSAMLSLYRAGIPILEAHGLALKTSPVAHTRANLSVASHVLERGEDYASAIETAAILDPETLQLIQNGERSGSLEESLMRAMTRRREVLERRITRAAKIIGSSAYLFAILVVVYVVLTFYTGLYAGLGSR